MQKIANYLNKDGFFL